MENKTIPISALMQSIAEYAIYCVLSESAFLKNYNDSGGELEMTNFDPIDVLYR